MLKPSGGFFKKMFNPNKMTQTAKEKPGTSTAGASNRQRGNKGPLNKAVDRSMGRKAAY